MLYFEWDEANQAERDPDMLDEYDFSEGVRGKYAERYAAGTNVVVLAADVAEVFPTSSFTAQLPTAARCRPRRRRPIGRRWPRRPGSGDSRRAHPAC